MPTHADAIQGLILNGVNFHQKKLVRVRFVGHKPPGTTH